MADMSNNNSSTLGNGSTAPQGMPQPGVVPSNQILVSTQSWVPDVDFAFPKMQMHVRACMASACATLLEDLNACPNLVLVGPPSSNKTTILDFFASEHIVYTTDDFTPRRLGRIDN